MQRTTIKSMTLQRPQPQEGENWGDVRKQELMHVDRVGLRAVRLGYYDAAELAFKRGQSLCSHDDDMRPYFRHMRWYAVEKNAAALNINSLPPEVAKARAEIYAGPGG